VFPLSSHTCLGGWDGGSDQLGGADIGSVNAPPHRLLRNQKERSCLFRHVCFDAKKGVWTYFAPPGEFRAVGRFAAGVDIWARGDFSRASHFSVDQHFVVHRGVPSDRVRYLDAPVLIKIAALAPANFGHFLGNAMFPAFEAAWRFYGARSLHMRYQLLLAGFNQTHLSRKMLHRCLEWARQEEGSKRRLNHASARGMGNPRTRARRQRLQEQGERLHRRRLSAMSVGVGGKAGEAGRRLGSLNSTSPTTSTLTHSEAAHNRRLRLRAATERCSLHTRLVNKFATELIPGLSEFPLLWEGSLSDKLGIHTSGTPNVSAHPDEDVSDVRWLCARSFIVGTGDFGFSTVHQLLNGTRRRPPKLLWGDFIRRIIERLDPERPSESSEAWTLPQPGRRCAASGPNVHTLSSHTCTHFLGIHGVDARHLSSAPHPLCTRACSVALLVVKHGRRAMHSKAYGPLHSHMESVLKVRTQIFEPATMRVADQIKTMGRGAIAITPDG
ncbi:MAG: hypothetical protein SGPRY_007938, partial [Prymnesium sp.]